MAGKYEILSAALSALKGDLWRPTFGEIEKVLGFSLPDSARKHNAWWANNDQPGRHASAWISVGWSTAEIDLTGERVLFRRGAAESDGSIATPITTALPNSTKPGAVECRVGMVWLEMGPVSLDADRLVFPGAETKRPAIYRFSLQHSDGSESCYVGETNNLYKRFSGYRNPSDGQPTNRDVNGRLKKALTEGATVTVSAIFDGIRIEICGVSHNADLQSKTIRCLLENAAIMASRGVNVELLNKCEFGLQGETSPPYISPS